MLIVGTPAPAPNPGQHVKLHPKVDGTQFYKLDANGRGVEHAGARRGSLARRGQRVPMRARGPRVRPSGQPPLPVNAGDTEEFLAPPTGRLTLAQYRQFGRPWMFGSVSRDGLAQSEAKRAPGLRAAQRADLHLMPSTAA